MAFNRKETIDTHTHTDNHKLLNNGAPTYFSSLYGTFSTIDLSPCDPKITPILQWDKVPSLNGRDHFPILITCISEKNEAPQTQFAKWNLYNADWGTYYTELQN